LYITYDIEVLTEFVSLSCFALRLDAEKGLEACPLLLAEEKDGQMDSTKAAGEFHVLGADVALAYPLPHVLFKRALIIWVAG
jgi:hypothetical protein